VFIAVIRDPDAVRRPATRRFAICEATGSVGNLIGFGSELFFFHYWMGSVPGLKFWWCVILDDDGDVESNATADVNVANVATSSANQTETSFSDGNSETSV